MQSDPCVEDGKMVRRHSVQDAAILPAINRLLPNCHVAILPP